MIDGKCFTNIDFYGREEWPKFFVDVPKIGTSVQSRSGKILKVCDIIYCYDTSIIIELGKEFI